MLALLLTLTCCAQGPYGGEACTSGAESARHSGWTVRGTVELSPAEADAAAESLLAERARGLLAERGSAVVDAAAPAWLPSFTRRQILHRWLTGIDNGQMLRVVEHGRVQHDHGGLGSSFRTELVVEPEPEHIGRSLSRLRRQVPAAAEVFAVKCGGILAFWVVLAAAIAWLDRLSRGYMTWRLRLLGLVAGSTLPAAVLLLV
jgi:hypothetical protein